MRKTSRDETRRDNIGYITLDKSILSLAVPSDALNDVSVHRRLRLTSMSLADIGHAKLASLLIVGDIVTPRIWSQRDQTSPSPSA
jgi:hypothetical protein